LTKFADLPEKCRGWKQICTALGVSRPTAVKIMRKFSLLAYDDGAPVLDVDMLKKRMYEEVERG
jgi:hypothetical protein